MAMDGIWTFVIPERQGGGVIIARNGKLYGGDIGYFFEGIYSESSSGVQGTIDVTLFNGHAALTSIWGDPSQRFKVQFQGTQSGGTIAGRIQRVGMPAQFSLTLTRRADIP